MVFFGHAHRRRIGQLSNHGSLVDEEIEPFKLILKTQSSFKVKYPLRAVMKQLIHDTYTHEGSHLQLLQYIKKLNKLLNSIGF